MTEAAYRWSEYPCWWDGVPELRSGSEKLELRSKKCDVAIVGAGYTGLAAARQLARSGASVLVLERSHVGSGASSRNGGQVLTGLKVEAAALVHRYGERPARELFDASLTSIERLEALLVAEAISCEYQRTGHIQAAAKPSHFEGFRGEQALLQRVFNHRVELVAAGEQASELGSRRYHGLLVDERSGALNPARYVHGLALAAGRAGATVVSGVAVSAVVRHEARWTVKTTQGEIDAGAVLMATNGYTTRVAPALQRRFIPIGSYAIATEPLADSIASTLLPKGRMAFDSNNFLHYFRLTADRRLLFGGRAEFSQPTSDTGRRAALILRRGMLGVFPELADTRVDYAWGGTVAFTRDEMPHAGQLGGLYYAGGYCGHGIAMATYLGELIARRIAGEPVTHPLLGGRFPAIPLYTGTPWFLPLVGAFYKVKDWIQ